MAEHHNQWEKKRIMKPIHIRCLILGKKFEINIII